MSVILAAKRTAVVPRGGAFARLEIENLGAPVVQALLVAAGISAGQVDELICSNALGRGAILRGGWHWLLGCRNGWRGCRWIGNAQGASIRFC